jgi:ribose 5-phosphate isomerase B
MRIALAADHAGFALKEIIKTHLAEHEVMDFGAHDERPVDYPVFALRAARAIARDDCDLGVFVCGSGIGMSIAANRVKGVRAALCVNSEYAALSRRHNDANVLCLPARFMAPHHALMVVDCWISTDFEGGRHADRVEMLDHEER